MGFIEGGEQGVGVGVVALVEQSVAQLIRHAPNVCRHCGCRCGCWPAVTIHPWRALWFSHRKNTILPWPRVTGWFYFKCVSLLRPYVCMFVISLSFCFCLDFKGLSGRFLLDWFMVYIYLYTLFYFYDSFRVLSRFGFDSDKPHLVFIYFWPAPIFPTHPQHTPLNSHP